jgi:thioredoxin 1
VFSVLQVLDEVGVEMVPTFVLLRGGHEAGRVVGVAHKRPAARLAQAIRKHLL